MQFLFGSLIILDSDSVRSFATRLDRRLFRLSYYYSDFNVSKRSNRFEKRSISNIQIIRVVYECRYIICTYNQ